MAPGRSKPSSTAPISPQGRVGHWQMKCQHIGLGQQFVERCGQPDVFGRLGNEGVKTDDSCCKRSDSVRNGAADSAEPDDADCESTHRGYGLELRP